MTDNLIHFIELPYEQHLDMLRQGRIDMTIIAQPKDSYLNGLEYLELCRDTCAFGVNYEDDFASKAQIHREDLSKRKILCGTYNYMEKPFEELLEGTDAKLEILNTEYNLESRVQAKFSDSMIVFHSHWKNWSSDTQR